MNEGVNWKELYGCIGWFNTQNGMFEIVEHTRMVKASSNTGPTFVLVGEKDDWLRISADGGLSVGEVRKEFTRVITPLV